MDAVPSNQPPFDPAPEHELPDPSLQAFEADAVPVEESIPAEESEPLEAPAAPARKLRPQQQDEAREPRRRLSVRGLVILLSAASITAAWLMNSGWSVRKIEVEGNTFTAADDIIKASELAPGTKPDSLEALQVILRIEKLPYIAEARLEPNPPGAVKIVVREREPVAILSSGSQHVILDNKGVKMPVIAGKVPDLPLVYGFSASFRDTLKGKAFETVAAFLAELKKDPLAMAAVGEVGYDAEKGVIAVSQRNNVRLYFGHNRFDVRLKSLEAFYAQVIRSRGLEKFEWIDFRFDHQVVTKELS